MNLGLLLIPIFFVALVIWVAWPLLAEGAPAKAAPAKPTNGKAKKKQRKH